MKHKMNIAELSGILKMSQCKISRLVRDGRFPPPTERAKYRERIWEVSDELFDKILELKAKPKKALPVIEDALKAEGVVK